MSCVRQAAAQDMDDTGPKSSYSTPLLAVNPEGSGTWAQLLQVENEGGWDVVLPT